ncbi:MAG: inositol monophosphatase [Bacteroidetes bacterium]|nr:MAG: inositol monophosphatase [Bacteroidota bacterium]
MESTEKLCKEVIEIAKSTGAFIFSELDKIKQHHIESKGTHDYVTYVDKKAEEKLVENLQKLIPNAGFLTEENTIETRQEEYMWVIDPLDGTTNFIHGIPCFSISVALMHKSEVILGVVYEINLDECFYSWGGGKAYLNGNEIRVSETPRLSESLLATGFPYHDYSRLEKYLELFTWCLHNTHGVRRLGSAAVDLAYVACGRFDAFFEYGLNAWDVAAGAFIVEQAGGRVTDFSGEKNFIFGRELIATNSIICDEFLERAKDAFS